MITEAIHLLTSNTEISYEITRQVMNEIMNGKATDAQIAAFLIALRMKGETTDDIAACAAVLREHCIKLNLHSNVEVMDIVGTGGDEAFTFNISTIVSFIVAATGILVAKHGNRSVSSKCGAADVLEALGAKIDLTAEQNEKILNECGMCFLFAPKYHTAMKSVATVRKELGVRTIFNIMGPLANPAGASIQLLGVYDEHLVEPMSKVLLDLGIKRGIVVHGKDGLDEISVCDDSIVCEIKNNTIKKYIFNPEKYGVKKSELSHIKGGNPYENAKIFKDILEGKQGAKRDIVILNAALSIYLGKNLSTIEEGIKIAEDMIDSGKAKRLMEKFIKKTNEF